MTSAEVPGPPATTGEEQKRKESLFQRRPLLITLLAATLLMLLFYLPMPHLSSQRPFLPLGRYFQGELPLWNPNVNAGCPIFCDPRWVGRVNIFDSALFSLVEPVDALVPAMMLYLFLNLLLMAVSTQLLLRRLGVEPLTASLAAALLIIQPQPLLDGLSDHSYHLLSLSLLPAVLYFAYQLIHKPGLTPLLLGSLLFAMQLLRGSAVVSLITLLLLLTFIAVSAFIKNKGPKAAVRNSLRFLAVPLFGALGAAYVLWPALQLSRSVVSAGRMPTLHWSDLLLLIYPAFNGNVIRPEGAVFYIGALNLFLIGFVFLLRRKLLIVLLASVAAAIAVLGVFHSVAVMTHGLTVLFVLLTVFSLTALHAYQRRPRRSIARRLEIYMLLFLGAAAAGFVILFFNEHSYGLYLLKRTPLLTLARRHALFQASLADAAAVFMLVGLGFILIELFLKSRLRLSTTVTLLFLLMAADSYRVAYKIRHQIEPLPKLADQVKSKMSAVEPFRVFATTHESLAGLQSVTGRAAVRLETYNELLNETGLNLPDSPWLRNPFFSKYTRLISRGGRVVEQPIPVQAVDPARRNFDRAVLDLLNVRFLLCGSPIHDPDYRLLYEDDVFLYENLTCLPRAFFADSAVFAPAGRASYDLMREPDFDPRRVIILEKPVTMVKKGEQRVLKVRADDTGTEAIVETSVPSLLVFSEIYCPTGRTARVDGRPAPVLRADAFLCAVPLPAGSRHVTLGFRPPGYREGRTISLLTAFICIAASMRSILLSQKKKRSRRTR